MIQFNKINPHYMEVVKLHRENLSSYSMYIPYPALITVLFVLVIMGHIVLGLNNKVGNPAEPVVLQATQAPLGSIWLAISHVDDKIVVLTSNRKMLGWTAQNPKPEELQKIIDYIEQTTKTLALAASLEKKLLKSQTVVTLAVDKSMRFQDFTPMFFVLAQAGISEYAFEVKQPIF